MTDSAFTWENIHNKRVFLIIGATKDKFTDDSFQLVPIQRIVFDELREQGYDRIVFWNFRRGIHTFDEKSFRLMKASTERPKAGPRKKLFSKACQGHLIQNPAADASLPAQPQDTFRLNVTDAYSVFRMLRGFYEDWETKTAIVIDDAKDFLERFAGFENVPPFFNQMAGTTAPENDNFFVFINLEDTLGDGNDYIGKIVEEYRHNNLFQKMFMSFFPGRSLDQSNNQASYASVEDNPNLIQVKRPTAHEIRRAICRLRLEKGLKVNFSQIPSICVEIERAFANLIQKDATNSWVIIEERMGKSFAGEGRTLTLDNWHEAIGVPRPSSVRDEINALVGQKDIIEYLNNIMNAGKERGKREGRTLADSSQNRLKRTPQKAASKALNHIVLLGNPGTGKTTIARLIGRVMHEAGILERGHLIEGSRETLVGQYIGQTAYKTKNAISRARGGVLFIDEAYELVKNDGSSNDFGQEALAELIAAMTRESDFIVVLAGYRDKMRALFRANPGLARRVREFTLLDYTWQELRDILIRQLIARKIILSQELTDLLDDFCQNWIEDNSENSNWGNGGEVDILISEMEMQFEVMPAKEFGPNGEKRINKEHILNSAQSYKHYWVKRYREEQSGQEPKEQENPKSASVGSYPEAKKPATNPSLLASLDDMVGMNDIKKQLRVLSKSLGYYKVNPTERYTGSFHNLITGAPGTGKTRVAKIIANIYKDAGLLRPGHFIRTNPTDFSGGGMQSTERLVNEIVQNALGGILFIDEAYALKGMHSVITKLVQAMTDYDGKFGLIIAGYEKEIDALLKENEGWARRFKSNRYNILPYTGSELAEIFLRNARKRMFAMSPSLSGKMAPMCGKWVQANANNPGWGNAGEVES
ncbi:MAG: AAA family ATPase, partial [Clostridiales bacterium]|nr:AAA family ATPase [Clostridiales bacterium]